MANNEHKLMVTPVSVNDGFKRADGRTWVILGATVIAAGVIVLVINLLVPKPKLHWPTNSAAVPARQTDGRAVPSNADEPKTYDVAPPSRPQKNR